jgi:ubiquinone/menaquinone biosynthesis C-methylase UbiE
LKSLFSIRGIISFFRKAGEKMESFTQSKITAYLQEIVAKRREQVGVYAEAVEIIQPPKTGCLLEVGCGSGRQLKVVHERHPNLELFGLDLSTAAIENATRNLVGQEVDLRQGTIESTTYPDEFFDLVTCFSSMSYWKNMVSCFNEIFRILKPCGSAKLVEPQSDIDLDQVVKTIKANMAQESWFRRFFALNLNKYTLKYGRSLGLKLYSSQEIAQVISKSKFGKSHMVERVVIQDLPIFMLITMDKSIE